MKHLARLAAVVAIAWAFALPAANVADAAGPCRECLIQCAESGATSYDCYDICWLSGPCG